MSNRLTNPRIISTLGACSMLIAGLGIPAAGATTPSSTTNSSNSSVPGGSTPGEPGDGNGSSSTPNQCTYRSVNVNDAKKTQGLPGQYTSGYSKKQNKLYVASAESGAAESTNISTLARVNPETLQIEATAKIPVVPDIENDIPNLKQFRAPLGVTVDDDNGLIWVTDGLAYSVSAYDMDTLQQVWTSYDPAKKQDQQTIQHPREIKIDPVTGKLFVTGNGMYSIDPKTKEIKSLEYPKDAKQDSYGMHTALNSADRELYVTDWGTSEVLVFDADTLTHKRSFKVTGSEQSGVSAAPHGVAYDNSLGKLYITVQGGSGINAGIYELDKNTGQVKDYVKHGYFSGALAHDEERDLLYVADYGESKNIGNAGNVAVFDARQNKVVKDVRVSPSEVNFLTIQGDGSVVAVSRDNTYKNTNVDFRIDPTTGEYQSASVDEYPGKESVNITASTLSRFKVEDAGTAPGETKRIIDPASAPEQSRVSDNAEDEATASAPKTVYTGQKFTIAGEGWYYGEDQHSSDITVTLDEGKSKVNGQDEMNIKLPEDENAFTREIEVPSDWKPGEEHTVTLSSGKTAGDVKRSLTMKFKVEEHNPKYIDTCAVPSQDAVQATEVPFAGYPKVGEVPSLNQQPAAKKD
ncbi:MAG: YncE family protein [Rothia sp. (in: high G+C Gram-positive bacteria)]|uniref:YncE family protein n=1 Tax=Rothia sp. (in: high G+C Gram-positive bacteria) TaxID=1885016 RepID=UPI0026DB5C25|nr:YncE family protein [Rothia sp. (in: high G+C Gram-positive bacteria)]MDO4884309.1 YncE family protein [Rothia sp. (in: high G+C Gram-positive bacteria)]